MAGPAEELSALYDIRAPEATALEVGADAAAAVAVGLVFALLLATLARLVARRPPSRRAAALADLAAARALPHSERLLAQARLLRRLAPDAGSDWPAALDRKLRTDFFTAGPGQRLRDALYRPGADRLDPDVLDHALSRLLRRLKD